MPSLGLNAATFHHAAKVIGRNITTVKQIHICDDFKFLGGINLITEMIILNKLLLVANSINNVHIIIERPILYSEVNF